MIKQLFWRCALCLLLLLGKAVSSKPPWFLVFFMDNFGVELREKRGDGEMLTITLCMPNRKKEEYRQREEYGEIMLQALENIYELRIIPDALDHLKARMIEFASVNQPVPQKKPKEELGENRMWTILSLFIARIGSPHLNLAGCNLSAMDIERIFAIPKVKKLTLAKCGLRGKLFSEKLLANPAAVSLEELDLTQNQGIGHSDNVLPFLFSLPNLAHLSMSFCDLREMSFAKLLDNQVTPKRLKVLNLLGNFKLGESKGAMRFLFTIPGKIEINIVSCGVTQNSFDKEVLTQLEKREIARPSDGVFVLFPLPSAEGSGQGEAPKRQNLSTRERTLERPRPALHKTLRKREEPIEGMVLERAGERQREERMEIRRKRIEKSRAENQAVQSLEEYAKALGVDPGASPEEVIKAYKKRMLELKLEKAMERKTGTIHVPTEKESTEAPPTLGRMAQVNEDLDIAEKAFTFFTGEKGSLVKAKKKDEEKLAELERGI